MLLTADSAPELLTYVRPSASEVKRLQSFRREHQHFKDGDWRQGPLCGGRKADWVRPLPLTCRASVRTNHPSQSIPLRGSLDGSACVLCFEWCLYTSKSLFYVTRLEHAVAQLVSHRLDTS